MKAKELREKYFDFFKEKNHALIPSASLVPANDPSVLFISAGMQPLVPYLSGQKHPSGQRIVNIQKCMRTVDFENIGDNTHHTFFQMLGNWSLGDYFKEESLSWSYEFLTKELKIPVNMLAVTVYQGDEQVPKDTESYKIWESLGIPEERIAFLGDDNFWIAGESGPCGPSSEIFYWTGDSAPPREFDAEDENWVELWNNVFMAFNKDDAGKVTPLKQKNVDTGMGFERTLAILNGKKSAYETDLFGPIINKVKELSGKQYQGETVKPMRIIADHLRAAVFILGDENAVMPSNLERGYILRRLIRRAIRFAKMIGLDSSLVPLAEIAIKEYGELYSELITNQDIILAELKKEEDKFKLTVEKGLREFDKLSSQDISGKNAFLLFQSYGFPLEMTEEMADEKGIKVDTESFLAEYEKHQAASKKGVEKKFKGGLADLSLEVIRLHTATHLLNEVLRKVISPDIKQRGSNITPDRLRFDFSFDRKLTPEEILKVEDELNRVIKADLAVERKEMSRSEAEKIGAEKEFGQKYPEIVSVYLIGDYSKEFCGGPHVEHTGELGHFKIIKEQSSSAGVRRIKAVLE